MKRNKIAHEDNRNYNINSELQFNLINSRARESTTLLAACPFFNGLRNRPPGIAAKC
ncbi:MAG: hypothetical protein KAT54_02890 [Candidatus Marinimicrobia bacterium]|nr:hypothetical protein [Candidatus Neomarinimicrobiota bacterium]